MIKTSIIKVYLKKIYKYSLYNLKLFYFQEETLSDLKERIVNKTGIPDKELEKVSNCFII